MDFDNIKNKAKEFISDVADARRAREDRAGADRTDEPRRRADRADEPGRAEERADLPPDEPSTADPDEASPVERDRHRDQPTGYDQSREADRAHHLDERSQRADEQSAAHLDRPGGHDAGALPSQPTGDQPGSYRDQPTDSGQRSQAFDDQSRRDPADVHPDRTADRQSYEGGGSTAASTAAAAAPDTRGGTDLDSGPREQLVPASRADSYGSRWDAVRGAFVDEPRQAVAQADALVGELLDEMEQLFREQRRNIEHGLDTDETNTEDLRLALRRYRSFFDRLLSL